MGWRGRCWRLRKKRHPSPRGLSSQTLPETQSATPIFLFRRPIPTSTLAPETVLSLPTSPAQNKKYLCSTQVFHGEISGRLGVGLRRVHPATVRLRQEVCKSEASLANLARPCGKMKYKKNRGRGSGTEQLPACTRPWVQSSVTHTNKTRSLGNYRSAPGLGTVPPAPWDPRGRLVQLSPACVELTGHECKDFLSLSSAGLHWHEWGPRRHGAPSPKPPPALFKFLSTSGQLLFRLLMAQAYSLPKGPFLGFIYVSPQR